MTSIILKRKILPSILLSLFQIVGTLFALFVSIKSPLITKPRMFIKSIIWNRFFLIFCIICSCANKDTQEEKNSLESDSLETVNSISTEDSAILYKNEADIWMRQALQKTNMNWHRFHLEEFWYEDSLPHAPFNGSKEFFKDYSAVLKWSPDSTYILDMGSLGSTILKDKSGNSYTADGDIDTQISLLFPGTSMKSDLLFFGSNTSLIDAHWIDSIQIAVFGFNEYADQSTDTLLWIINAKDNYFRMYKWE